MRTVIDGMWICFLLFFCVVGRDFIGINEVLQMTSGERKCWNITILDDFIIESSYAGPGVEWFYLFLWTNRASGSIRIRSTYATVHIIDNDRGMHTYSCSFQCDFTLSLNLSY